MVVLCLGSCGRVDFGLQGGGQDAETRDGAADALADAQADRSLDAEVPSGFGPVTMLPGLLLGTRNDDDDPSLTGDLLEIYFNRGSALYVSERDSVASEWNPPQQLTAFMGRSLTDPVVSRNGLFLVFASITDDATERDLRITSRARRGEPWGPDRRIDEVALPDDDVPYWISDDGLEVWFGKERPQVLQSSRPMIGAAWSEAQTILTPDPDRTLVSVSRSTPDGNLVISLNTSGQDLLFEMEAHADGGYGTPTPVAIAGIAPDEDVSDGWLSPDGRSLWFTRGGVPQRNIVFAQR